MLLRILDYDVMLLLVKSFTSFLLFWGIKFMLFGFLGMVDCDICWGAGTTPDLMEFLLQCEF